MRFIVCIFCVLILTACAGMQGQLEQTGLDCTESPDTEINIVVDLSETGLGSTQVNEMKLTGVVTPASSPVTTGVELTIGSAHGSDLEIGSDDGVNLLLTIHGDLRWQLTTQR